MGKENKEFVSMLCLFFSNRKNRESAQKIMNEVHSKTALSMNHKRFIDFRFKGSTNTVFDVEGLSFKNCFFSNILFSNDFDSCHFDNCHFNNCKFKGDVEHSYDKICFENCFFESCHFDNLFIAIIDGNASFFKSLKECNFEKLHICFSGKTDMENIQLLVPYLEYVDGDIYSTWISGLRCSELFGGIIFTDCVFENCDFSYSNINAEYLENCMFRNTIITSAELVGDFRKIEFDNINFAESKLSGKFILSNVDIKKADVSKAQIYS